MAHDENEFARRAHVERLAPVDMDDATTRSAWCTELGVDEVQLRAAVAAVGPMPVALRFYLRNVRARAKSVPGAAGPEVTAPETAPWRD